MPTNFNFVPSKNFATTLKSLAGVHTNRCSVHSNVLTLVNLCAKAVYTPLVFDMFRLWLLGMHFLSDLVMQMNLKWFPLMY